MKTGTHEIHKPDNFEFLRDKRAILDIGVRKRELILQAGAFMKMLPRREWGGKDPKWSDVYQVAFIDGQTIIDTHGARHPLKLSLPVKDDAML